MCEPNERWVEVGALDTCDSCGGTSFPDEQGLEVIGAVTGDAWLLCVNCANMRKDYPEHFPSI